MNEPHCKSMLCYYKAHSLSEWRKAALNKKKELQQRGHTAYEAHPEYQTITKCKPDDNVFPSKSWCHENFGSWSDENQSSPKQASPKQASPKQASPSKQASPPSKKASTPGKKANTGKRTRCKKGTRFNKRTQNCQPK